MERLRPAADVLAGRRCGGVGGTLVGQLGCRVHPGGGQALTASWKSFLAQQHTAVVAAQQAKLADALKSAGGPQAVLASARHLVAVAAGANLDAGNVAAAGRHS